MALGSRSKVKKAKNVELYIDGIKLKHVCSFKYLGFTLDSTLNYSNHIATVIRTVSYKLVLLSKIKRYLTNESATQLYKSMILPYFDYGDVIYSKAYNKDIDRLQRLQNRSLRLCGSVNQNRIYTSDERHKLAKTPFLKDGRIAHTLNFMYKRTNKHSLLNTREIRTRAHDAPLFNVTIPRCEAFKRSVGYHGSVNWNNLDVATRNINSFLKFKLLQSHNMLNPLNNIII